MQLADFCTSKYHACDSTAFSEVITQREKWLLAKKFNKNSRYSGLKMFRDKYEINFLLLQTFLVQRCNYSLKKTAYNVSVQYSDLKIILSSDDCMKACNYYRILHLIPSGSTSLYEARFILK